jgi:hypothetical protein
MLIRIKRLLRRRGRRGGVVPQQRPASHGLGLCDVRNVLTPQEYAKLQRDLASLAAARRRDAAKAMVNPSRVKGWL